MRCRGVQRAGEGRSFVEVKISPVVLCWVRCLASALWGTASDMRNRHWQLPGARPMSRRCPCAVPESRRAFFVHVGNCDLHQSDPEARPLDSLPLQLVPSRMRLLNPNGTSTPSGHSTGGMRCTNKNTGRIDQNSTHLKREH